MTKEATSKDRGDGDAVDPGPVSLRVRDVTFDLTKSPLHWIPGFPVVSHMISAYHLLVPEAERFFIVAFKEALPLVKDDRLREDMLGFIGQEMTHAAAHDNAIDDFLVRHEIDVAPALDQVGWLLQRTLGPREFATAGARRRHLVERLAVVAAIENFTAFFGDFMLNNSWADYDVDPNVADLMRWHGAEEMEHRAVAHDVVTYFDPGYLLRLRAMAVLFPLFIFMSVRLALYVVRADPATSGARAREVVRDLTEGGRRGLLPKARTVIRSAFNYLRPSFTPDDLGPMAPALDYLARVDAGPAA